MKRPSPELAKEWRQRLKESGFRDIELPSGDLRGDPISAHPVLQDLGHPDETPQQTANRIEGIQLALETTQDYYRLLEACIMHATNAGLDTIDVKCLAGRAAGWSDCDIADAVGVHRKTVRSRIAKAVDKCLPTLKRSDDTYFGLYRDLEMLSWDVCRRGEEVAHPVHTHTRYRPSEILADTLQRIREDEACRRVATRIEKALKLRRNYRLTLTN